ncbi:hypothetical protein [Actinomycetospora straminea]|uniref:MEDS domain-containing protein n=1 Tax=Actinomycetospora straminea TaxID=663607 RepID=A0ABP9F2D8_9PSEU|nr:hypothetical protein [Actinomycetospora straminea]MDD7932871.1 hypothetical protein [Actinomycetospora straminea]
MTGSEREGGLVHLALLHDGPDDLVFGALAEVRRALADGDEVLLVVDRATVRAFREALGHDAARVGFPPPSAMLPPSDPGFLAAARDWVRPGRRTTVLGQYPAAMPAPACRVGEDGLNAVRRDLPLTVICCCRRDADPELVAVARSTHPHLAAITGRADNPDFRPPATSDPVPADLWGAVAARLGVDGTGDLAELRRRVGEIAARAGLEGDAVRAAVLAVHEAAVLGCRGDVGAGLTLEVRARPGQLFAEVVGPPRSGTASTGDLLSHLRPFCTCAAVHEDAGRRAVRVLATV